MYIRYLLLAIAIFQLSNYVLAQKGNSADAKIYRFIYSLSAMHVTSVEDAEAVSKVLAEHIKKKFQRGETIEIKICRNKEELTKQLTEGYDLIVISTEEFLSLRKQFRLSASFTNDTDGSVGFNYLIIVNKDDNISDISQVKGIEIYVQSQTTQGAPELLLNKLLSEKKLPKCDKFFSKIIKLPSTNNVVLPVFFKKARIAMVTEQSLRVLKEINPQIEKQLKIIYRSPTLILGVSCFNETTITPDNRKLMTKILTTLHEDDYGKQLLNLFSTDKLVPFKDEYLKGYLAIFGKQ